MTLDEITVDLVKTEWLGLPQSNTEDGLISTNLSVAKATVAHSIGRELTDLDESELPLAIGAMQILVYQLYYNLEPVGGHPVSPTFTFFIHELKDWRI